MLAQQGAKTRNTRLWLIMNLLTHKVSIRLQFFEREKAETDAKCDSLTSEASFVFQWDIIVRRASLVSKYNLPDYGSEPWSSLHDFDEIFDRKFGKPAVSEKCACLTELNVFVRHILT